LGHFHQVEGFIRPDGLLDRLLDIASASTVKASPPPLIALSSETPGQTAHCFVRKE